MTLRKRILQTSQSFLTCLRVLLLAGGLTLALMQSITKGAEAIASSATGALSDPGTAAWRFTNPKPTTVINWECGFPIIMGWPNYTDGAVASYAPPRLTPFAEPKFSFPPTGGWAPIPAWTGFRNVSRPGPANSKAVTQGVGGSWSAPGSIWGTNAYATWVVRAGGILGTAPPAPSWKSRAAGNDPWPIEPSDFIEAGITGLYYDLFFAVGLEGANYSTGGEISLDVLYETAFETTTLLNISLDATGATLTNDNPANLRLYLLGSIDEGPTENPDNLVTLLDLQVMLQNDVEFDCTLDNPVYLGIVWPNIPVPTVEIEDGSVAILHANARAIDAIPEPATLLLLGLGGFALVRRMKR